MREAKSYTFRHDKIQGIIGVFKKTSDRHGKVGFMPSNSVNKMR